MNGAVVELPLYPPAADPLPPTAPPLPIPPSQVGGVRVAPMDGGLRVSWDPAGDPAGTLSQYRVHAEDDNGRYRREYTDPDTREAVVDGLVNSVEYTVTVTALAGHSGIEGPASEPVRAMPGASGAPDADPAPVPALPAAGAVLLAGLLAARGAWRCRRMVRG